MPAQSPRWQTQTVGSNAKAQRRKQRVMNSRLWRHVALGSAIHFHSPSNESQSLGILRALACQTVIAAPSPTWVLSQDMPFLVRVLWSGRNVRLMFVRWGTYSSKRKAAREHLQRTTKHTKLEFVIEAGLSRQNDATGLALDRKSSVLYTHRMHHTKGGHDTSFC